MNDAQRYQVTMRMLEVVERIALFQPKPQGGAPAPAPSAPDEPPPQPRAAPAPNDMYLDQDMENAITQQLNRFVKTERREPPPAVDAEVEREWRDTYPDVYDDGKKQPPPQQPEPTKE